MKIVASMPLGITMTRDAAEECLQQHIGKTINLTSVPGGGKIGEGVVTDGRLIPSQGWENAAEDPPYWDVMFDVSFDMPEPGA